MKVELKTLLINRMCFLMKNRALILILEKYHTGDKLYQLFSLHKEFKYYSRGLVLLF